MNHSPDRQLQQGLEMTRQMLDLLKAEEWEAVVNLGNERMRLLEQWSQGADPDNVHIHIGLLQEIQALDREIEALSRQLRYQAASQLRQIQQGRKASKAYRG